MEITTGKTLKIHATMGSEEISSLGPIRVDWLVDVNTVENHLITGVNENKDRISIDLNAMTISSTNGLGTLPGVLHDYHLQVKGGPSAEEYRKEIQRRCELAELAALVTRASARERQR